MPNVPYLDSVGHYQTPDLLQKWTFSQGVGVLIGGGRRGNNCLNGGNGAISKTFDGEYSTLCCGSASKHNTNGTPLSLSNSISGISCGMRQVGDGRFVMATHVGFGTAVSPPILFDRWFYLEMKVVVTPTTISADFWINEKHVLSDGVSWPTPILHHVGWSSFGIGFPGGGDDAQAGDIYVDAVDTPYGDVNIDALHPNGPTSNAAWVPSPTVANWINVSDIYPDGDTTTVASTVVNDLDLYTLEHVPAGIVIRALQGVASVKKDTAGLAALKLQYGSGDGALWSEEIYPSEGAYFMARDGRKDPALLALLAANGMVFGQKRTQ